MAVPPSVVAHSSSSFLLFISSLSFSLLFFLLLLYLRNKKRGHPWLGCREKEHHHLRRDLSTWDPPPQPSKDGGEKDAAAAAEPAGGEDKGRRKKARKKRGGCRGGSEGGDDDGNAAAAYGMGEVGNRRMDRIYPFSSFASSTQRRIKLQYDEIVESNKAKTLTVAQVGQFINCLVDARNELQRKSEIIQRSFKIKKALLYKADRSSFDRLCQQIYKLEAEHKRVEEDATVYNLLQEQLKLSPAYKTMLEVSANMEQKAESDQAAELPDISFEEFLAQEKKDLFWQRNRKLR
ncbi:unnamed protein product [Musa acuminata subsp. burmannicoides]